MAERKIIVSGRRKILQVLAQHPRGLNAAKIRELVLKEYAISEDRIAKVLWKLAEEGKITKGEKCGCPSCALRSIIYKFNPGSEMQERVYA